MKKRILIQLILVVSVILGNQHHAQELLRGPYLQVATHNSIVVRWRTDVPTTSKVSFGSSTTNLSQQVVLDIETTEHEVKITGLQPLTKYYYSVGTTTASISGPSEAHFFKTHPEPGTYAPLRAWVVGDQGKGNQGQKDVRDAYLAHSGTKPTDMWLMLGDIVYDDGTDAEYQTKCFEIYPNEMKNMPIWPTPGNHDYNSVCAIPCNQDPQQHTGPYYDIFTMPKDGEAGGVPSGTELYYSFDYGNIRFINLNSELGSATGSFNYIGAGTNNIVTTLPMYQWFVQDLQDALDKKRDWIIVYWHQPPYSKGSHNSDDFITIFMKAMRENFVPVMEDAGVDLMLGGHSHVFERSYLAKGHYGNSSSFNSSMLVDNSSGNFNAGEPYMKTREDGFGGLGTVYTVLGNSGSKTSSPSLNHPIHYAKHGCDTCYGSFILEIDGNRLDGTYLASDGTVRDQFTILKENTLVGTKPVTNELSGVKVYPNPFENLTNIEFSLSKNSKVDIALFDLNGKKVADVLKSNNLQQGQHNFAMDVVKYNIGKGVYYLNITVNDQEKTTKMVKVK
jgi:acid phosphatase type 7